MWDYLNMNINFINWYLDEFSLIFLNDIFIRDCIDILRMGFWNDCFCFYLNLFICEKFLDESEFVILG